MKSSHTAVTPRSPRPSPLIHDASTVRYLSEATLEAWKALARWRVQPPLVEEWERVEAGLRRAARLHAPLLVPMDEEARVPSPEVFPSLLNTSAQRLMSAGFEARWFVARTQEKAGDDWLLTHAPVVFSAAPWTDALEAALHSRGLPSELAGPVPEEAQGLAQHARGSPALLTCLPYLHALCRRQVFGALLGTRGVEWLRAWLLGGVDAALVALAGESGASAVRLRAFVILREGLLAWGPYQPLAAYARTCLAALGVPVHLQGEVAPLLAAP